MYWSVIGANIIRPYCTESFLNIVIILAVYSRPNLGDNHAPRDFFNCLIAN